jgi:hypothetical protein
MLGPESHKACLGWVTTIVDSYCSIAESSHEDVSNVRLRGDGGDAARDSSRYIADAQLAMSVPHSYDTTVTTGQEVASDLLPVCYETAGEVTPYQIRQGTEGADQLWSAGVRNPSRTIVIPVDANIALCRPDEKQPIGFFVDEECRCDVGTQWIAIVEPAQQSSLLPVPDRHDVPLACSD